MDNLNKIFFLAVLQNVKKREDKVQIVGKQLFNFFELMETMPYTLHGKEYCCKIDKEQAMFDQEYIHFLVSISEDVRNRETTVGIGLNSAGKASLFFTGSEFNEGGESVEFSMDSLSSEEITAKILTTIQDEDINYLGPNIAEAMQKIWSDTLMLEPKNGPGLDRAP